MKKWLFPVASAGIFTAVLFLLGALGVLWNGDGTGYGGVVTVLCGIVFCGVVLLPIVCILYARRCLAGARFRILFTVYHSFLLSFSYLLLFFAEEETLLYALALFGWCELWSLFGFVSFNRKKR